MSNSVFWDRSLQKLEYFHPSVHNFSITSSSCNISGHLFFFTAKSILALQTGVALTGRAKSREIGINLIEIEKIPSEVTNGQQSRVHRMDWVEYHSLEDIYEWFDYIETKYEFCEQEIIGESYEGREMRVMKV